MKESQPHRKEDAADKEKSSEIEEVNDSSARGYSDGKSSKGLVIFVDGNGVAKKELYGGVSTRDFSLKAETVAGKDKGQQGTGRWGGQGGRGGRGGDKDKKSVSLNKSF